jgi:uncharacterized membrane protein YhaH (DUF805 family)
MNLNDFIIDTKDAKRILIGSSGTLGPKEFAQGLVAVVAASLVLQILSMIPGLGIIFGLAGLVLIYPWVCIFSKRFHDAGQSGWMTLAAIAAAIVLSIVLGMILNPLFGVPMAVDMSSMQAYAASRVIVGMVTAVLVNFALGFYMYRLQPKAA